MVIVTQQFSPVSKSLGDSNVLTLKYWVDGTFSEDEALQALIAQTPPVVTYFKRIGARVDSTDCPSHWDCSVSYGPAAKQSEGADATFSMEIGTSMAHVTQSLGTVGMWTTAGSAAPNNHGVIGGKADGSVDGVEKMIPQCSWTETHYLPKNRVNRAYFDLIYNSVATMNAAFFRSFERGEVLFIGGNLQTRMSADDFECQFKFLPLPNANNLNVGDIGGISKLGHDYLWVQYTNEVEANNMRPIPYRVFVERIYQFTDYDSLRLPDPF
jgi:hypothetical protein